MLSIKIPSANRRFLESNNGARKSHAGPHFTEAIPPGGVTFGRGFKESAVVSLTVSRS